MSVKSRKIDDAITCILNEAGAVVTEKARDGASHQRVSFIYRGQTLRYHYPATGQLSGHSFENNKANLRRLLRSVPEPVAVPEEAPKPASAQIIVSAGFAPQPRVGTKLSQETRREIAKRYASTAITIDALAAELTIERTKLETLFLSQRGQAADKLRREMARHASHKPRPAYGRLLQVLGDLNVTSLSPAPSVAISEAMAKKLRTLNFYGMSAAKLSATYKLPRALVVKELVHAGR